MAISHFNDKANPPAEADLRAALEDWYGGWQRVTAFMLENYQLEGVLQYGGKNYGWHFYYKRGSKPLLSLYPHMNGLTAQVVLGKSEVEKAMDLPLGEATARALRDTPSFHDGKWLFLKPASEKDLQDILSLILTKSRPVKPKAQV
jgi:hypothetical protein